MKSTPLFISFLFSTILPIVSGREGAVIIESSNFFNLPGYCGTSIAVFWTCLFIHTYRPYLLGFIMGVSLTSIIFLIHNRMEGSEK